MTTEAPEGREPSRVVELTRQGAILRRIADLETTIARQRIMCSDLSARGLPTVEVDRIIDILIVSLEFVRNLHATVDSGRAVRDEHRASVKAASSA